MRHEEEALRYVFLPTGSRTAATRSALKHLVETFFEGSTERAVAALLDDKLSDSELDRLGRLIQSAKGESDERDSDGVFLEGDGRAGGGVPVVRDAAEKFGGGEALGVGGRVRGAADAAGLSCAGAAVERGGPAAPSTRAYTQG